MKKLKMFSLLAFAGALSLTSCKSEGTTATDAAREAVTETKAATPTPAADPAAAVPTGPTTTVEFEEEVFDYGEIMEGEKVTHVYKFKNTGNEPLVISNAKGSCGCTVPDWPKAPIAAGESGEIKVVFDSKGKGKVGGSPQSKRVTITANTDPVNSYLTIKGTVNKEEAPAS
jgi:hypothetical protein